MDESRESCRIGSGLSRFTAYWNAPEQKEENEITKIDINRLLATARIMAVIDIFRAVLDVLLRLLLRHLMVDFTADVLLALNRSDSAREDKIE